MPERPPLTSSSLQSLDICAGKAQRDARIASFLQSQRRYVSHFASEGLRRLAEEDGCTTPSKHNEARSPSENHLIGFATPTLKPRISKKKDKSIDDSTHRIQDRKVESEHKNPHHNAHYDTQNSPHSSRHKHRYHHRHHHHKHDSPPTDKKKKHAHTIADLENKAVEKTASKKKKREHEECTSEIERDARLEERRARKKKKREIMKAPSSESGTEPNATLKNSKEDKKKVKLPAGLALMQSFIAPNVGKDRLTLKTPFSTGVFLKGKASEPKKVGKHHKKGNDSNIVSVKLNDKNLPRNRKPEPKSSTRDELHPKLDKENGSTSSSITDEDVSAVQIIPHKIRVSGKPPIKRASSIVWDIERQSMSHSSTTSRNLRRSKSMGTIVLDTDNIAWTQRPATAADDLFEDRPEIFAPRSVAAHTAADHEIDEIARLETPASSISPSQSASQVDLHPTPRETISRFFAQLPPLEDTYAGGGGGSPTPPRPTPPIQMNPLQAPKDDVESPHLEDDVDMDTARLVPPVTTSNFPPASVTPDLDDPLTGMVGGIHDGNIADVDRYRTAMMMRHATLRDHDLIPGLDVGVQGRPVAMYDGEDNLDLKTTEQDRPFRQTGSYYESDFLEPHTVGVRVAPGSQEHHDISLAHYHPYLYERDCEHVSGPEALNGGDGDVMPYQEWLDECEVDGYLRDEREYEYDHGYDYEYEDDDRAWAEQDMTMDMQDNEFGYDAWSEEQFAEEEEPMYYEHAHEEEQGPGLSDHAEEEGNTEHASMSCEDDAVEEMGEDHGEAFQEGRALLLGLSFGAGKHRSVLECGLPDLGFVTDAELDVGKNLRDHWRPQRL